MAIPAKVLLLGCLASSSKLSNRAGRSGLRSLSAGVGVNFGIEDQDIDVFAGSENVVKSAEADVVCPAVAAEDPNGLLDKADPSHCESLLIKRVHIAATVAALAVGSFDSNDKISGSLLGSLHRHP